MLFADRFAESLKAKREERHLTQQQLADRLGVNVRTIRRWEAGERCPGSYALLLLRKHLDLPPFIDLSISLEQFRRNNVDTHNPDQSDSSPGEHQPPHTYFIPDIHTLEENERLYAQGKFMSAALGGLLAEQDDPVRFPHILDIGCGVGDWLIELAKRYPSIERLEGIDINTSRIAVCQSRVESEGVENRVRFQVMDALGPLAFKDHAFDLVNLRATSSFVRFWEWGGVINEVRRVLKHGGTIRLVDFHHATTTSEALDMLGAVSLRAAISAGYAISTDSDGTPRRFELMLAAARFQNIQAKAYYPTYKTGTPEGTFFAEDMIHLFKVARPFYEKWVHLPEDYDTLYQQMIQDVTAPDFEATWPIETVWAIK